MKKFTKLWQLMMILMLTSSVVFAQRQTSIRFGENQKLQQNGSVQPNELTETQIRVLETNGITQSDLEEGLSRKAIHLLNKYNLGPAPGGNTFKPVYGGPSDGSTAWGINLQAPNDFASFDAGAPSTAWVSIANPSVWSSYGGDYDNVSKSYYYVIDNNDGYLKTIDVSNGAVIKTVGIPDFNGGSFTGMACDRTTGTMYAEVWNGTQTDLYTLNLSDATATLIGSSGVNNDLIIDIAIDGTGTIYGWGLDDNAYTIDNATGASTLIGPLGVDLNYAQGGSWDPVDDIIYLCAYNLGTSAAEMYTLNKTTGALTFVDALPGETDAMGFPNPTAITPTHDVMVTVLTSPVTGTNLTATETVSLEIYNAGTVSESNIPVSYIYDGGAPENEVFAGPLAPGASASYNFTATVDASALGTHTINACTNLSGDEIPANDCVDYSFETFAPFDCQWMMIGEDSYGDGWNSGSVEIIQDGISTFSWTGPPSAGPDTVYFDIWEGASMDVVWHSGSYDSEVTYGIYALWTPDTVLKFSDGPYPAGTTGIALSCFPPACPEPLNLITDNETLNGATANWDEAGSATTWNIVWGLPGFDPTDPLTYIGSDTKTDPFGSSPFSYAITGLNSSTVYEWYVQADCGGGSTSSWAGQSSFATLCEVSATPFFEGFESGAFPICWSQETTDDFDWTVLSGSTISSGTGPSSAYEGTYYIYTETSNPVVNGNIATIYTPEIDLSSLTTPELTFAYHMYGAGMDPDGSISIGISTDGGTSYTNIWSQTGNQGNQWNMATVDISAYSGTVIFSITGQVSSTGTSYENDFAIDAFSVNEAPTCPDPTALGTDNPTVNGLDLIWTSNSGLSNVEWDTTGFSQGTGNMATGVTSPYTVALVSGKTYDFYVQDDCGSGDLSNWVGPYTFTFYSTPPNNDCSTPDVAAGPFPETFTGATYGATVNCSSILPTDNGNIWYEIQLPYAMNTLVIDISGNDFDGGWAVASTVQCSCDINDYLSATSYNFPALGTLTDLAFENIPGPSTIWYPVQTGSVPDTFDITFNVYHGPQIAVTPTSMTKGVVENGNVFEHLMVGNSGDWKLDFQASVAYPSVGSSVLFDDFEAGLAAWTVINNGGDCVWDLDSNIGTGNLTNGSGDCASADSDECGQGTTMDTELRSSPFDLSGYSYAQLTFEAAYNDYAPDDSATVNISIDGGTSWINLIDWHEDHDPESVIVDLTPFVGNANCMLSFIYYSPGWNWYFQIDNVNVSVSNTPFPPVGWLTVDGAESTSGTVNVGDPSADVIVGFDATGISPGTYTADIIVTSNDASNPTLTVPITMVVVSGIIVDVKVFLEGPYDLATGNIMFTDLNNNGYLPLTQPYNPPVPYYGNNNPVWLYPGTQTVTTIPTGAVDWVIVQARDAADAQNAGSATITGTTVGFLMADGSIVGLDGVNRLGIPGASVTQNLFLVVYHRNHLGVMSGAAVPMVGNEYVWDFTTGAGQAIGDVNAHKDLGDGNWGMISADGNATGNIEIGDKNNSWQPYLNATGFEGGDFDLNGTVEISEKNTLWLNNLNSNGQIPAKGIEPNTGYKSQIPK